MALGRGSRTGGVLAVARGGDLVRARRRSGSLAGDAPRGPRRPRGRPVGAVRGDQATLVGPAAGLPRRRRRAAGRPARRTGAGGRRCRDGRARAGDVRGPAPGGSRSRTLARAARPVASQRVRTGGDAGGVARERANSVTGAARTLQLAPRTVSYRLARYRPAARSGTARRRGPAAPRSRAAAGPVGRIRVRLRLLLASGGGLRTDLPSYRAGTSAEGVEAATETAERLGWHSVWTTDHLLPGPEAADEYGSLLEAVSTLAYLGGRFQRIGWARASSSCRCATRSCWRGSSPRSTC